MADRIVHVAPAGEARIGIKVIKTTDDQIQYHGNNIVVTDKSKDTYVLRAEDIIRIKG
jgi:hypothetical protein